MSKVTFEQGVIQVPDQVTIPFIEGDGVGVEITPVVQKVVDAAIIKVYGGRRKILWKEVLAGEKAFRKSGEWLPEETLQVFREYLVGLKGPLTTPIGGGIRSLNVALRQELDLYVCLRPVRWFKGIITPVKEPNKVDMVIFRENTEDIYAGIEWLQGTPEAKKLLKFLQEDMGVKKIRFPESSSFGIKPISEEGSKRLARAAINYAVKYKRPYVTLVHKGNIMKFTEGGFKKWGYEVADQEFADSVYSMEKYYSILEKHGEQQAKDSLQAAKDKGLPIVKDMIADAFLQSTLLRPEDHSVVATMNLNGDYISDQLAAMVGGIGIAPGANINYNSGHAIFEATHGTAPTRVGQNSINPSSVLLSSVMLLEYLGWQEVADRITYAMEKVLSSNRATVDLARFMPDGITLSTTEFGESLIEAL